MRKPIRAGVPDDMERFAILLHIADHFQQEPPGGNDSLIRLPEMLLGPIPNGAHTLGGKQIMLAEKQAHPRKGLVFHLGPVLQVAIGRVADRPIIGVDFCGITPSEFFLV